MSHEKRASPYYHQFQNKFRLRLNFSIVVSITPTLVSDYVFRLGTLRLSVFLCVSETEQNKNLEEIMRYALLVGKHYLCVVFIDRLNLVILVIC